MTGKKKYSQYLNTLKKALKGMNVDDALSRVADAISLLPDENTRSKEIKDWKFELPQALVNKSCEVAIFSDGACRGNPGPGSYCFVLQKNNGDILKVGSAVYSETTNNRMELLGVIEGLISLSEMIDSKKASVLVVSDSQYVLKGMKEWMPGWKARGWKKADNKQPENVELWQSLDVEVAKFGQVHTQWVRGHAGHPQNEYCDYIANEALDEAGH